MESLVTQHYVISTIIFSKHCLARPLFDTGVIERNETVSTLQEFVG